MNQGNIWIRTVDTQGEAAIFWEELQAYFDRDIFPPGEKAGREHCGSEEYRKNLEALWTRRTDPLYFLYFQRGEETIGFAMAVIYSSEDGKCFILEFCVYPRFRGGGVGAACARALMAWARQRGASYFQLNADREDRRRFWGRLGFLPDGADQWGEPLMECRPGDSVHLEEIGEDNWVAVRRLAVRKEQQKFLDTAEGILARGYVYRNCRARVFAVFNGDDPVGLALVRDLDEEPACYELQQFMVDARFQNRGYGTQALRMLIHMLTEEGRYDSVELCVKTEDAAALRLYGKLGFSDTGYVDPALPDSRNLRLGLGRKAEEILNQKEKRRNET